MSSRDSTYRWPITAPQGSWGPSQGKRTATTVPTWGVVLATLVLLILTLPSRGESVGVNEPTLYKHQSLRTVQGCELSVGVPSLPPTYQPSQGYGHCWSLESRGYQGTNERVQPTKGNGPVVGRYVSGVGNPWESPKSVNRVIGECECYSTLSYPVGVSWCHVVGVESLCFFNRDLTRSFRFLLYTRRFSFTSGRELRCFRYSREESDCSTRVCNSGVRVVNILLERGSVNRDSIVVTFHHPVCGWGTVGGVVRSYCTCVSLPRWVVMPTRNSMCTRFHRHSSMVTRDRRGPFLVRLP